MNILIRKAKNYVFWLKKIKFDKSSANPYNSKIIQEKPMNKASVLNFSFYAYGRYYFNGYYISAKN